MKTALSFFICVLLLKTAFTQDAPNFTFTDTKGTVHDLYETLDAGKTVVLDFFYVDCAPCLFWTSATENLYQKWGGGNADVEIWAFSDKDENAYLETYAADSGVTYTLCGIEGGAANILNIYDTLYGFSGYPSYSVICSDRSVSWDLWPFSDSSMPEIDDKLTACGATGVITATDGPDQEILIGCIWPNPAKNELHLNLTETLTDARLIQIRIYAFNGAPVYEGNTHLDKKEFVLPLDKLAAGMYYLVVTDAKGIVEKEKFIKL